MSMNNANAVMEGLMRSRDIYNLLANLYFICAKEFTRLNNLIEKDSEKTKFLRYLHTYKHRFLEVISHQGIFEADFQEIIGILKNEKIIRGADYLIITWAFLKAIDLTISDTAEYLNTIKKIWCGTSDSFGPKKYRLLFKPRNLILDTIKNTLLGCQLKSGIDIGQRIEDHLQKIIMYEEHPSRRIEFKSIDKKVNGLITSQGQNLAIAVAPIYYGYDYSFKRFKSFEGVPYVFDEIKNRQEITNIIDALLRKCIKKDVHIVVFPELSIDEQMREYISNWLKINNMDRKIIMVIAGSYHILSDEREEKYENSCIVYRFDGKELWVQKKMNRFQLDEKDINKIRSHTAKGFQDFKNLFKETDRKGWEHIEISDTLVLYDSPIGRMAVTICLDFIVKEKDKLLLDPHANIIFVPAMSGSLKKMDITNKNLGDFGAASVFCANNCWVITGGEKGNVGPEHTSYIYIPHKDGLRRLKCNSNCDGFRCDLGIFRISQISNNY